MGERTTARCVVATALVLACLCVPVYPPAAAAFQLDQQTITAAGGRSSSASFQLSSCLRPEALAGGQSTSTSFVLYAGCGATFPADDGDGVPSSVEDGAPNNGDGNGDGIADELQGWVASLPSATNHGYLTVEACADSTCSTTCQLQNVETLSPGQLPASTYTFPYGLVQFTVHCSPAYIHILYHGTTGFSPQTQYIKFGADPAGTAANVLYQLPGVVFGSESVGTEGTVASASFVLYDGQLGDDDHVPGTNGVIIDAGGPAFSRSSPVPILTSTGLTLAITALLLVGLVSLRRQRFRRPRLPH